MANEQINVPSLVLILFVSGVILRYLFFSPSTRSLQADPARQRRQQQEVESAADRLRQMFPQVDRRTILWELQRNGGNMSTTTERILAGRTETPPRSFQPPIRAPSPPPRTNSPTLDQRGPDLITRYKLHDKIAAEQQSRSGGGNGPDGQDGDGSSRGGGSGSGSGGTKGKAWSANKDERQSLLQRRRDQMILDARRKMEAKIAAEKAA